MALIMGLNSGSSFDGIDAVLAETELAEDGHPTRPRFIDGYTHAWPPAVEALVMKAFVNELSIFELTRLNYIAGACYAEAARGLLTKTGVAASDVAVIGYDGQTIYQEPADHTRLAAQGPLDDLVARWLDGPYPCGLQIGDSSIVACHTDINVVSHFRAADHAFGGTGAPLMQYLDYVAFRDERPLLTLNIGGIANFQLANPDRNKMMAFDTGPGCVMLDHTARRLFDKAYDPDGSIAASGTVDAPMLADLLAHPYFQRPPPRSAWKLDFGAAYCDGMIDKYAALPDNDIMATFCAFTAASIAVALRDYIPDLGDVDTVAASGGGTRNTALMGFIADQLPAGVRLTTTDEYGIPAQFKEAIKFAVLGYAAINHVANNIPACSGATRYTVMGRLALAPRYTKGAGPLPPADGGQPGWGRPGRTFRREGTMLSEIRQLYETHASAHYGGGQVTQLQHGLQCAHLAARAGAAPALITAALLHDIGHLVGNGDEGLARQGIDARHERIGAGYLRRWFGPEVTEPIRLHAAAKAYLCATEAGYFATLSQASVRSLALQGGVMAAAAADHFLEEAHANGAIQVRRWDELAKDPAAETPELAHFLAIAESVARGPGTP